MGVWATQPPTNRNRPPNVQGPVVAEMTVGGPMR